MEKIFSFAFLLMTLAVGFATTSCSGGDEDNVEKESQDDSEQSKDLFNIDSKNLIVGNWIEKSSTGSYTLFCFKADGTYVEETRSTSYHKEYNGNYSNNGSTLTLIEHSSGKEFEKKIYQLGRDSLRITGYTCRRTTLSSLADGAQPSYEENALTVRTKETELGYGGFDIYPFWGVSYILYSVDKTFNEKTATKYTNNLNGILEKTYKSYNPGTTHKLTAVAYDKEGRAFKKFETSFKMPGDEITNYYFFRGKQYPISEAEMSVKHGYSGTNTGSHFKYLRFIMDSDNRVQFEYAVHEWDGIDKEWGEGSYKIGDSRNYYTYGCLVLRNGNAYRETSGKLVIKKNTSKYMTFDFTLEETRGHFEGVIQ